MYRILTICTGNICRSPMAELILRRAFADAGLEDQVEVASAGTTSWELGEPIDPRAANELTALGIASDEHRARQTSREELAAADLVLALDHDHMTALERLSGGSIAGKLHLLRRFDPDAGEDLGIRDPWYGDQSDFASSAALISHAAEGVVGFVREELQRRAADVDAGTDGAGTDSAVAADAGTDAARADDA